MPKTVPELPASRPGRCHSARSSSQRVRLLAGKVGDVAGTPGAVPGGIEAETRQMLENVGALLHAVGLDYGDVVKATVYLKDFGDFAAMNTIYRTYFPTDPPTRATVGVTALAADYRVEIEVIATR